MHVFSLICYISDKTNNSDIFEYETYNTNNITLESKFELTKK